MSHCPRIDLLIEKYSELRDDLQVLPESEWDSVDWTLFNTYTELLEDLTTE